MDFLDITERGLPSPALDNNLPDGYKKECVMTTNDKPIEVESVKCEVCLKEVPVSEATVPEASDYFVHFCGLDCYAKWKEQAEKSKVQVKNPVP